MQVPNLPGTRILDLTRWLPGPYAALVLADLGAQVIKVERPEGGDPMRQVLTARGEGEPGLFETLNRGKRSLTLNLKHPRGQAIFVELARSTDVLLEGFRPGVMDRLGLGYGMLARENPRLVYVSVSAFGQTGPHSSRAGHDLGCIALAGLLGLTGGPEGPPVMPGLPLADLFAAMWTVAGTLAALVARHHSGEGCHLDISMLDSVSSLMAVPTAEWRASGKAPQRGKMWLTGGKACYNVYETADGGHMSLGALEPSFWRDFCQATERPEWLPRQNEADQAALIAEVAALFKMHSRDHWTRVFGAHDCCCEPVLSLEEASLHPQVQLRGLYSQGHLLTPLSRPNRASVGAPALGQHTEEILAELGLDSEEVQRLRGDGAL